MPIIEIKTLVTAPIKLVFDLARDVDFHQISTSHASEKAMAGKTSGLMNLGDWATWEAKHFGFTQKLTSEITQLDYPNFFVDIMVEGAFKSFTHYHYFKEKNGKTEMKDVFYFESPFGLIGRFFNFLVLKNYMENFLQSRNLMIKKEAENKFKKLNPI